MQALKISQEGSSLEEDNKVVFSSFVDFIDDQEMEVDDDGVDDDEDEMVVEDEQNNQCDIHEKERDVYALKELQDRGGAKNISRRFFLEEDNKFLFSSFVDFIDDQEMEVDDDGVDDDED
ncbi:hypothetical protein RYX36_023970 [Vicia faba]